MEGGLECGLEGTTKTNVESVETIHFLVWDLRHISSANSSLTIESTKGSGLWCKIIPHNASKSLRMVIKNWTRCYSSLWAI